MMMKARMLQMMNNLVKRSPMRKVMMETTTIMATSQDLRMYRYLTTKTVVWTRRLRSQNLRAMTRMKRNLKREDSGDESDGYGEEGLSWDAVLADVRGEKSAKDAQLNVPAGGS